MRRRRFDVERRRGGLARSLEATWTNDRYAPPSFSIQTRQGCSRHGSGYPHSVCPGAANLSTAQRWFKKFRNGDESLKDVSRGGRPSDVDNDELKAMVEADPRVILDDILSELNFSIGTVPSNMRKIGKTKKPDKWVSHELSDEQKNRRFEISTALLLRHKNDAFLVRIVTRSGFYTTTGDVLDSDWTRVRLRNIFRS
uniref:HTH_48 domain-containing protein n=1 Tax=Haemonchus contortus TaxID=6289 RepID=A0A7I4YDL9_HAECO